MKENHTTVIDGYFEIVLRCILLLKAFANLHRLASEILFLFCCGQYFLNTGQRYTTNWVYYAVVYRHCNTTLPLQFQKCSLVVVVVKKYIQNWVWA